MRSRAAIGAMLMVVLVVTSLDGGVGVAGDPASARAPSVTRKPFTVTRAMTMNDPTRRPGSLARLLRSYIEHTPRGSTISIMSLMFSSSITWPALSAAYKRGVNIRAVLYGGPDGKPMPGPSSEGVKLANLIDDGGAHGRRGSWVVWTRRSARGKDSPHTVMHTKLWQFSRVGRSRKVTMIGSYNNGDTQDARSYSAMVTLTDAELYGHVQSMFLKSAKDRRDGQNPQRRFSGDGWDAYFFPSTPITPSNDPVMERLRSIPGDPDTQMTIAMFSMQGRRGRWLGQRLASMVEGGAELTFVVGPGVAPSVVRRLRTAGATLEDGCWKTGRKRTPYIFTHDKEMTATWVTDGVRHHAAWIGSDDWGNGSGGSQSDQATIGLYSTWAYTKLNRLLAPQIAHEPDKLTRCDPV